MNLKGVILLVIVIFVNFGSKSALDAKKYLYKYGYLTSLDYVDDDVLMRALKEFQKSVGIPQTGELDDRTRKLMNMPRCGMLPLTSRIIQDSSGIWKNYHLTYKIQNWTESLSNAFTESQFNNLVKNVIEEWTRNVKLTINESSTNQADLNIYFTQIDGVGEVLGQAYPPEHGGIYLDQSENLTLTPFQKSKISIGWVLAHEIGHAIGLEHTPNSRSIMYECYTTETKGPSMLDVNNLVALYGGVAELNNDLICAKMAVDTMLYVNEQHILIKDGYYWTFDRSGLKAGPFWLQNLYPRAPDKVDAVTSIGVFTLMFSGNRMYRFQERLFIKRKSIEKAFEKVPSDIDAAFYEAKDKVIHFFKGSKYYVYDTKKPKKQKLVVNGTNISDTWIGIPDDLDAATMIGVDKVLFAKKTEGYIYDMGSEKILEVLNLPIDLFKCLSD